MSRILFILSAAATTLFAGTVSATTRWEITNSSQSEAMRIATEQAKQRAIADRTCYIPATAKACRPNKGSWICSAESPDRASDCGVRGRWKRAVMAR